MINQLLKSKKTLFMGILNVTPDSFSDGGNYTSESLAISQAQKLIASGADILDIGGESSRPGSDSVSLEEELQRVIPVIQAIRKFSQIPISVDTTKAQLAEKALIAGANIINDITGFQDDEMIEVCAQYQCPVICMHMQGEPKTMQETPQYADVVREVKAFFEEKIEVLKKAGIPEIVLDPGIGFGKTFAHNWEILRNLSAFQELNRPILLGVSRKSFLQEITGIKDPIERDEATFAIYQLTKNFVDIWRVHNLERYKK